MHLKNVKQKLLIATLAGVMVSAGVAGSKDTAQAAEADAVMEAAEQEGLDAADADGQEASEDEEQSDADEAVQEGSEDEDAGVQDDADLADDELQGAAEDAVQGVAEDAVQDDAEEADTTAQSGVDNAEQDAADAAVQDGENVADTADKKETDKKDVPDAAEAAQDVPDIQKAPVDTSSVYAENGWVTEGSNTYYYIDGEKVKNTIMEIDGNLYYFGYNGAMSKNVQIGYGNYYYRAKSNGVLYRNEWYNYYGDRYYYGENGAGYHGIQTVSGTQYLFRNGKVAVGEAVLVDGVSYAGDENGAPVKLKKNGWTEVNGHWFYCENGAFVNYTIREINGKFYGFSSLGYMYADQDFYANYNGKSGYCRAKADGTLYRSEWYKDPYSDSDGDYYYYYTKDFFGATGYTKVGSSYYVFEYNGYMNHRTLTQQQNIWYILDKDGHAKPVTKVNGWIDSGDGDYYYFIDGEPVRDYVIKDKDGKYYGFGSNGRMYSDSRFYVKVDGEYIYYRAKKDGSLYVKEWYEDSYSEIYYYYSEQETNWYYYGAEGKAANGLTKLGGKTYCFDYDGRMMTSTKVTVEGVTWFVDSEGLCTKVKGTGWIQSDGKYYYSVDGELVKGEILQIGKRYYAFNGDGVLYTNQRFNFSGKSYRAAKTGALLENQWFDDEYYGEGGVAPVLDYEIDGKKYYFGNNTNTAGIAYCNCYVLIDSEVWRASAKGVLSHVKKDGLYYLQNNNNNLVFLRNGSRVTAEWVTVDGSTYYFDDYGYGKKMEGDKADDTKLYVTLKDGSLAKNGWIRTQDGTYYAKATGELLTGEQKIDGKRYLFNNYGRMRTGILYVNDAYWRYGNDGARVGKALTVGWNKIEGDWYYVKENGSMFDNGAIKIDEKDYYFSNYRMMSDYVYNRSVYGKNGQLVLKGWYQIGDDWYYVDPETSKAVYSEVVEIGGKKYYFDYDGVMQADTIVYHNDKYLTLDANGVVVKEGPLKKGFILTPMGIYGYNSGNMNEPYTGWAGEYYVSGGMMMTGMVVDGKYYVGEDGKRVKKQGWQSAYPIMMMEYAYEYRDEFEIDGYTLDDVKCWYYVKANGEAAVNEWLKIGGSWYYFDSMGIMIQGPRMINGKLYLMTMDGKWIRTVEDPTDGWYEYEGSYIYVRSGQILTDTYITKFGLKYYLDERGIMLKDSFYGLVDGSYMTYFSKNGGGDTSKTGWQKINGKYYYFLKDGRAAYGWVHLGKQNYYIDMDEGMLTGTHAVNGQLCTFNSNGALVSMVVKHNGWYEGTDGWYYFRNGYLLEEGEFVIGGKTYYFDDYKMVANAFHGGKYYDKNGQALKNTWKKIGGSKYYFGSDGLSYIGFHKINGKEYLFDVFGRLIK